LSLVTKVFYIQLTRKPRPLAKLNVIKEF